MTENSDEDDFQEMNYEETDQNGKKDKKRKRNDEIQSLSDKSEEKRNRNEENVTKNPFMYIKGRTEDLAAIVKKKPVQMKRELYQKVGPYEDLKIMGSIIRISFKEEEMREKLMKVVSLIGVEVLVSKPYSVHKETEHRNNSKMFTPESKGIIFGIDEGITDEELIEETGAEQVYRLLRKEGQSKIKTTTVVLTFKETILPEYTYIGCMRRKVKQFIPRPIRCFRCQQYGHKTTDCKANKEKCAGCGGEHTYEDCKTKHINICPNCKGEHQAGSKDCPKYQLVQEVLETSVKKNVLFKCSPADKAAEEKLTSLVNRNSGRNNNQHSYSK